VNDARRYRMNAVECLSAANRCEPPYRGLILAVATSWHALARQDEAIDELLAIWNKADAAAFAAAIPRRVIAFVLVGDPVGEGLVAGLARPGGNATGFVPNEEGMASKWLELLTEIALGVKRAAANPDTRIDGGE
jgi:hypothetical protein